MKEIKLTQGKVALVDDDDYDYLNQWKWYARKDHNTFYALSHTPRINGKQKSLLMHNLIMKPVGKLEIDHIDRNGLNNQKSNLRAVTHQQNCLNQRNRNNSKYKGVSHSKNGRITANIRIDGKFVYLGSFRLESEAAIAFDIALIKYRKDIINTNFQYANWFCEYLNTLNTK